jgi:hypothetical protein
MLIRSLSSCAVIRASVPKMILDDVFEQKNEIAKAVENELEKVLSIMYQVFYCICVRFLLILFICYVGNVRLWV